MCARAGTHDQALLLLFALLALDHHLPRGPPAQVLRYCPLRSVLSFSPRQSVDPVQLSLVEPLEAALPYRCVSRSLLVCVDDRCGVVRTVLDHCVDLTSTHVDFCALALLVAFIPVSILARLRCSCPLPSRSATSVDGAGPRRAHRPQVGDRFTRRCSVSPVRPGPFPPLRVVEHVPCLFDARVAQYPRLDD